MQTLALAEKSVVVGYGRHGFDAEALMAALATCNLSQCIGFVYGSGFEGQPQILAQVSEQLPLIGNLPDTVAAIKHPATFFAALRRLNIHHPDVLNSLPEKHSDDYLIKTGGGSGGTHIRAASHLMPLLDESDYYQRKIEGYSVSLLFLASQRGIEAIGFNAQWLSPSIDAPYRYGGAVSNPVLPDGVQDQLVHAAEKLANEFGLAGLNSIDAIAVTANAGNTLRDDSQVFVLEINPRLSATVDLYNDANLFELHVQACQNSYPQIENNMYQASRQCNAHAIVYAAAELKLAAPVSWPGWVTDVPACSQNVITISAGDPVCTVLACAGNADAAKKLAHSRVETMQSLLQSLNQTSAVGDCNCFSAQDHQSNKCLAVKKG